MSFRQKTLDEARQRVADLCHDFDKYAAAFDTEGLFSDPVTLALGDCVVSGCGTPVGAQRPDFITVSMPNGYIIQPRIPYILVDPIPLKPKALAAYGGAS
jgi:hypothetical protein